MAYIFCWFGRIVKMNAARLGNMAGPLLHLKSQMINIDQIAYLAENNEPSNLKAFQTMQHARQNILCEPLDYGPVPILVEKGMAYSPESRGKKPDEPWRAVRTMPPYL